MLPPELAAQFGILPGERVPIEVQPNTLRLKRPTGNLARVYVEPTNICNLDCLTCMRNVWDEPLGRMSAAVFSRVLHGVECISPRPTVFFGGYGEPLAHPQIVEMVRQAKATGANVELITNATLLDEACASSLMDAGLDMLWVSLDGAKPESYADVRLGAALSQVLENLARFRSLRPPEAGSRPLLGIAFVAMRRNLDDLPEIIRIGSRLGASRFSVSNVLAHTPELREQSLYQRSLYSGEAQTLPFSAQVDLPRLDMDERALSILAQLLNGNVSISFAGTQLAQTINTCPFIENGSLSVRWDGAVSPCLPLLHTHDSYLDERERRTQAYTTGSVLDADLPEIWNQPKYRALRERLQAFDFSPCVFCNSCDMAENNQEDCFGNPAPTCGGCLWSQGLIRCP